MLPGLGRRMKRFARLPIMTLCCATCVVWCLNRDEGPLRPAVAFGFPDDPLATQLARAKTIGDRMVVFLDAMCGKRVGGGECAHAAFEALRIAGGEFTAAGLGADTPAPGDYVWGKLLKVIEVTDERLDGFQPGDAALAGRCPANARRFHRLPGPQIPLPAAHLHRRRREGRPAHGRVRAERYDWRR